MLPIFGCAPPMDLLLPICCWQQFLAPGGPPTAPQETTKMLNVIPQKPQMRHFSILGDENRVVGGWGGAAQLWAGKKLCSPNASKIAQKKISDQAHPLHRETGPLRSSILSGFEAQNRVYSIT